MVGSSTANSESFKVTTPSDCEIRLTRLFNARGTWCRGDDETEHVKHWWGCLAEGYSVPCVKSIFARRRLAFVNRHPKGEAAFHGEYREIARPAGSCSPRSSSSFPTPSRW